MSNILALRQKKFDLIKKQRAMLDVASAQGRDLNSAEQAKYNSGIEELEFVSQNILDEEARLDVERNTPMPEENARGGFATRSTPMMLGRTAIKPRKFAEMFPNEKLDSGGFETFDSFMRCVASGRSDSRLRSVDESGLLLRLSAATGANEAVPSDGGFAVPIAYAQQLLDASLLTEVVRSRATIYPMTTPVKKIAGFDGQDRSGGKLSGGLALQWLNEGATGTPQKGRMREITLTCNKAAIFSTATNELLADSSFEQLLGGALVEALSFGLDTAFLTGAGAGSPLGILNAPSTITQDKEVGQAVDTILYANCVKMLSRLHPSCMPNSLWLANSTTIPALLQMKFPIYNVAGAEIVGGSQVGVLSESDGEFRLLTRPILFVEQLPVLGDRGDLVLCDLSKYAVGVRKEISIDRSAHIGFMSDETSFRTLVRIDGQPIWSKPVSPLKGSTQSWCVALEAR